MKHIRFNKKHNKLIELREDETFCSKCKGKGVVLNKRKILPLTTAKYLTCDKCLGDGKLDWIEKATGKMKERIDGTTQSPPIK